MKTAGNLILAVGFAGFLLGISGYDSHPAAGFVVGILGLALTWTGYRIGYKEK